MAQGNGDVRPNILLIVTDDQRTDETMSVMPHTRAWFAEGTTFSNAFATTPLCCPSRASILTGRYAHNHGVETNWDGGDLDQGSTLQRYLHDAGYATAFAGRFLNGWPLDEPPEHFDRFALLGGGYVDATFNVDGEIQPIDGHTDDWIAEYAVGAIEDFEGDDARPWLLSLWTKAPHAPFVPAPRHESAPIERWEGNPAVRERDRSDKPLYVRRGRVTLREGRAIHRSQLRTLLSVDDLEHSVFETLDRRGELSDTLAIFTSDNGFLWGEHGLKAKSKPYTQAVHVPLLVRWPGRVAGGATDGRLVANVDLAPTILDAAGLGWAPAAMDGRSLLASGGRKMLLTERSGERSWAAMRTRRFHYIESYGPDGRIHFSEYYSINRDRWELSNLFRDGDDSNDPDRQALRKLLKRARACRGTAGATPCP